MNDNMADEEQGKTSGLLGAVGRFFLKGVTVPLGVLLLLVLLIAGGVFGIRYRPEILGLSKGREQVQQEADRLVEEVGKLIVLPEDERPTIATVTDVDAVKDQPFFSKAQNGDKVLIYTSARKAILYRPSENRILEVGLVNIQQENEEGTGEVEGESTEGESTDEGAEEGESPSPSPTPTAEGGEGAEEGESPSPSPEE